MPEITSCPDCSKKLRVPDDLIGKKVRCPGCSKMFTAQVADEEVETELAEVEEEEPVRRGSSRNGITDRRGGSARGRRRDPGRDRLLFPPVTQEGSFSMCSWRWLARAAGVFALSALAGCSGKKDLATVSGVVTHNGTPVEGATVAFHSTVEVDGKKQPSYAALTDSSGKYVIATSGKEHGIPPGLYKVTVTKYEGKGPNAPSEAIDQGQLDAQASDAGASGKGGPVNLLPKEYASPGSTKLSATLDTGKNENVNFDLKGK